MYLKVIVMEMTEKYALAMDETGRMLRIIKKPGMQVGDCIYVLDEDRYTCRRDDEDSLNGHEKIIAFPKKSGDKATGHKKIRHYIAAVAAALLIFVTALLTYGNSGQAYAMVSLDGRQSVQLTLDDKNIVKKAVSIDNSISNGELEDFVGKSLDELGRYFKERDLENERIIVGYAILKQASDEQKMAFHAYLEKLFGDNQAVYMEGTLEDIREAEFKQQTLGIYLAERLKEKGEWPKSDADGDDESDVDEEDEENEEV